MSVRSQWFALQGFGTVLSVALGFLRSVSPLKAHPRLDKLLNNIKDNSACVNGFWASTKFKNDPARHMFFVADLANLEEQSLQLVLFGGVT